MLGRAARTVIMAVLLILPVYFLAGVLQSEQPANQLLGLLRGEIDSHVKENMPFSHLLEQINLDLRLLSGEREQNGIFISQDGLMRNIDPPIEPKIGDNTREILAFARMINERSSGRKSIYLAIVPTASGVLQQNLPRYAQSEMVEQQRLIEEIYNQLAISVRTVDAYSALQNRRDQYIFYRTDNSLTGLGGYYTYAAVARRMEISNRSLGQYRIDYADDAFYGDLYTVSPNSSVAWENTTAPYRKVQPDTISLFRYDGNREYIVTKRSGKTEKVYHTLYPEQRMELGSKLDIYLGGASAVTEIKSSYPLRSRLLVFGDKTALSVLPFLANHYQQTTLVNLFLASSADLEEINPQQYDHVLFLYGIETFIHTGQPSQVRHVQWQDPQD